MSPLTPSAGPKGVPRPLLAQPRATWMKLLVERPQSARKSASIAPAPRCATCRGARQLIGEAPGHDRRGAKGVDCMQLGCGLAFVFCLGRELP